MTQDDKTFIKNSEKHSFICDLGPRFDIDAQCLFCGLTRRLGNHYPPTGIGTKW